MAMGLVKESGSYSEPDRRFAVALGCEASFASQFVYADGMQVDSAPATPIASSCRICPRTGCAQRAFPPVDRRMTVDPDVRNVRSEEHTSELQSLMRISYAVFCLKKKKNILTHKQPVNLNSEHI